jgi:two-component system, NtrC family, sensor histidine kinase KinB
MKIPREIPLGRKIKRGFFVIVALFSIFGAGMIFAIHEVGQNVPRVIHNNYTSIVAAGRMRTAWNGFVRSGKNLGYNQGEWIQKFEDALNLEKTAETEPGESQVVDEIESHWKISKTHPNNISKEESLQLRGLLKQLLEINHNAIFANVTSNNEMVRKVILAGAIFLFMTMAVSVYIAKIMAGRLSAPLKKITSILHQNPNLDEYLNLPNTGTLEVNILSKEMTKIWNRLSDLKKLDIEELAKRESNLQTILNSVDDAILVLDTEKVVIHCNPEMAGILGVKGSETIGKNWNNLKNVRKIGNYVVLKDVLTNLHSSLELNLNDKESFFEYQIKSISNDKGYNATILLLRNVTEKNQQERLKAEFIGVLSHELKTPLQSLSMGLELLHNKKKNFEEKDQLLIEIANDDAGRIRAVANEFMHVSLNRCHSLKLKFENVKISDAVEEWLKPFRLVAENKNVKVNLVNQLNNFESVNIDRIKFPWVLSNLLSNAIRVTPEGGVIRVSMQNTEDQLNIEVADEGPGIPEECRDKIFEPYFQIPHKNSKIQNGFLGIGLNIAREVITAHDGTLKFRPNIPQGAVFEVNLPTQDSGGYNIL